MLKVFSKILLIVGLFSFIFGNEIHSTKGNSTVISNIDRHIVKNEKNQTVSKNFYQPYKNFIMKPEFSTFCSEENLKNNPVRILLNNYISWLKSLSVKNMLFAIIAFVLYLFTFTLAVIIVGFIIAFLLALIGIPAGGPIFVSFVILLVYLALPASDLYFNNPLAIIGIPIDIFTTGIKLFLAIFGIYLESTSSLFKWIAILMGIGIGFAIIMLWNEKRKLKQILNSLKNIFYVVAMADGKLSKQEEKYLKRVMYEFARAVNLDKNLAQSLKKEEIKNASKEKIELYLKNLKPLFEKDKSLKNKLFLALVEFSLIDGLNEVKKEILEEIADELGLEIDDIEEYIAKNFYQQQTQQNDKKEDYYEVLGVGRDVSCNELKKKYRELVKKYHPDKISSKGLDEEFVKFAEEKFKKVTEAYEFLTKMKNCK